LLSKDGEDLADPIGCEQEVYHACAQRIVVDLEALLPDIQYCGWKANDYENRNR
jgi:hypothetical protein